MLKFIYHANCWDGFCSAWLGHLVWPDAEFIPMNYDWDAPDVTDADVIIADVSFKRPILLEMKKKAKSLIGFDHHKTAAQELAGLDFFTFDMNRSGAKLIWDYLIEQGLLEVRRFIKNRQPGCFPKNYTHWLVDYIQDRDLWVKKLADTEAINAAIRSYPLDFTVWDELSTMPLSGLIMEGEAILRSQASIIDHHLRHLQWIEIDGFKGKGCHCSTSTIWSEIMEAILQRENVPIAVLWCDTINGDRLYSIRSLKDGPDVSVIAKKRGGGGHEHAAGFRYKYNTTVIGHDTPIHTKIEKESA